jgi:hypothetical protein
MPLSSYHFFRSESIIANQVEVPPEKTAMDEDGLPALIEQGDDIIRGFRFVQQGPDVVGACCAIPRWLVPLNFEIGVFPALPGASKAKSTQGTLYPLLRVLLSVLRARSWWYVFKNPRGIAANICRQKSSNVAYYTRPCNKPWHDIALALLCIPHADC